VRLLVRALSVSISKTDTVGRYIKVKTGTITFDTSYPTNGEVLTALNLGFSTSVEVLVAAPAGGLIFEYDKTNSKLKAFYPTGGGATPAALAAPAVTVPTGATAVESSAAQPNLVETAGIAKEVGDTTDLATIVTTFVAFGY
jgi:hypothetical protein